MQLFPVAIIFTLDGKKKRSYRRDSLCIKASNEMQISKHIICYRLCVQCILAHKIFALID